MNQRHQPMAIDLAGDPLELEDTINLAHIMLGLPPYCLGISH